LLVEAGFGCSLSVASNGFVRTKIYLLLLNKNNRPHEYRLRPVLIRWRTITSIDSWESIGCCKPSPPFPHDCCKPSGCSLTATVNRVRRRSRSFKHKIELKRRERIIRNPLSDLRNYSVIRPLTNEG
jgi:hypothetical protein